MKKRDVKRKLKEYEQEESGKKKQNIIIVILLIVIILALFIFQFIINSYYNQKDLEGELGSFKSFSGGEGSEQNPYLIGNCTELQDIQNNLSANYALLNDIDCSATTVWNGGKGFKPIGNNTKPFNGNFNGNNHTILNLYINRPSESYVSLFGEINRSYVNDVGLENVSVRGFTIVSGLVGFNLFGNINNSYVTGNVSGSQVVGGLVGHNSFANISKSYSSANVTGFIYIGGLAGSTSYGVISDSYSSGKAIVGDTRVGGLVGDNDRSSIYSSYSSSNVRGFAEIGGIAGVNVFGNISNSYSAGNVSGNLSFGNVGGIVGYNGVVAGVDKGIIVNSYWNNNSLNATNCYNGGKSDFGNSGCTAISNFQSYFYNVNNPPMNSWNFFNVWSSSNDGFNYPILRDDNYYNITNTSTNNSSNNTQILANWCNYTDINRDSFVDSSDYNIWRDELGCVVNAGNNWCNYADVNRDGIVNNIDFDLWKANFGATNCLPEQNNPPPNSNDEYSDSGGSIGGGGGTGSSSGGAGSFIPNTNQTNPNLTSNNSLETPSNNEEIPIVYKKKEFNFGLYLILFIFVVVILLVLSLIILFRLRAKHLKYK